MSDTQGRVESKKVLKAGIGYTIGNLLVRGIGFLSIPIFTRLMSTGDYGLYNTYAAYESIFYLLVSLALNSTVKVSKLEYQDKFSEYMSTIISVVIFNAGIWLVLLNVIYPTIAGYMQEYNRTILNLLVVHSLGSALMVIYNAELSVYYQHKSYLKVALINSLGGVVLSILLISTIFTKERYVGRIAGVVLTSVVTTIIIICYFYRKAKPNFRCGYVKKALKYSLPVVPHGIAQVLLSQFDRIMIRNMVNVQSAGIYSFAGNISVIMKVVVNSVMTAWSPWFYEEYHKDNIEKIRKVTRQCVMLFAFFVSMVMLCAPEMLKIMAPEEYWDGVRMVVPMALDVFFTLLYSIYCEIEYYHKKTNYLMIGTVGAAAINIVLNYIMISRFDYSMAAWTTLFAYICYFVFHYLISRHIAGRDIFSLSNYSLFFAEIIFSAILASLFLENWIYRWGCAGIVFLLNIYLGHKNIVVFWNTIRKH